MLARVGTLSLSLSLSHPFIYISIFQILFHIYTHIYGCFNISLRHTTVCLKWWTKKTHNFFNINFLTPHPKRPILDTQKKLMCLNSWEGTQKRDPHELFWGDFWGQKRGPIFGHEKFTLLFFARPYKRFDI